MRRGLLPLLLLLAACPSRRAADPRVRRPDASRADAPVRAPLPPAVIELDARLRAKENAIGRTRGDWLSWESIALDYMTRARLTGDYGDYAKADRALTRAFEVAGPGVGPFLTRARFNHTVHRVSRVTADLDALRYAVLRADEREAIEHLRAEVAFHSGRYDEARQRYTEALARDRSTASLVGMAQLLWKTNNFRGAEALVNEAAERAAREDVAMRAWVHLVRGTMENDRGRWDEAAIAFREGLRLQPTSWVFLEHIAEVLLWQGKLDESRLLYEDLVARTDDPEFVNALAEIAERQGRRDDAARYVARARAGYEERLRLLPEATAGHAIEFFLARSPERAVPIAELNRDARPGGEAQVKLAEAYLQVGRVADARRVLDTIFVTPWNTADLHAVAARVYERLGDTAAATREREAARAIDPHSVEAGH
jgi:tetratricopeptide (TPR) repeat protein